MSKESKIIKIPLTQGKFALIDEEDLPKIQGYKWCAQKKRGGYVALTGIKNSKTGKWTTLKMHRLLMGLPDSVQVDHIDHDPLNNTRKNLRPATNAENGRNRPKIRRSCTSKYLGVSLCKQKWRASIKVLGKKIHIGYFFNEQEAARARDEAALRYHGEFACLNFPNDKRDLKSSWVK